MHPPQAGLFGLGGPELLLISFVLGLLVLAALPAIFAYVVLERIPAQYRRQTPALAFLLLIPFFALIWNFFVHPKVAESLRAYHDAQGHHPHGDCGASIARWVCICCAGSVIPLVAMATGPAALILLIIFYVKAFSLSAALPRNH